MSIVSGPLHRTPAGHVGPDAAEQAERDAMRLEILKEREASARGALEQEITRRLAERRSPGAIDQGEDAKPEPEPKPDGDETGDGDAQDASQEAAVGDL